MAVWDIEDAVREGERLNVCPFHMAQDQIQAIARARLLVALVRGA